MRARMCPQKGHTDTQPHTCLRGLGSPHVSYDCGSCYLPVALVRALLPSRVERDVGKGVPMTTLRPAFNAASTALRHFVLVFSASWLMCS